MRLFYSYLILVCLCSWGCSGRASRQTVRAEQETPADTLPAFQREWYCFNGMYIVQQDGKYGLLGASGDLILQPVYDSIEFLRDDIALVGHLGSYLLADTTGRIFAEGTDPQWLRDACQRLYEEAREEDLNKWDRLLDQYDELCRKALTMRGSGRISTDFTGLQLLRQDILRQLGELHGKPSEEQVARFRRINALYADMTR